MRGSYPWAGLLAGRANVDDFDVDGFFKIATVLENLYSASRVAGAGRGGPDFAQGDPGPGDGAACRGERSSGPSVPGAARAHS